MPLTIAILAAGQGTRMKSSRAKVIHNLAGKALLQHVVDACLGLSPEKIIVVVGHKAEAVKQAMQGQSALCFIEQHQQLGTGHAVAQCLTELKSGNDLLVVYGDVPLIKTDTLKALISNDHCAGVNILSFMPDNAFGYGRVVRDVNHKVCAIVEQKDADEQQQKIIESNSGIMFIKGASVERLIGAIDNKNAQNEYYLTDVVSLAIENGESVGALICKDAHEVNGVNNQSQLAIVESHYRKIKASELMLQGVKLFDPERIDIRATMTVGEDVEIDVGCVFEGKVTLADGVRIEANCVIRDTNIGADSTIKAMTMLDGAIIGSNVSIGPFARIRPGTECDDEVKIGNFVETKKAIIGKASKISHLSYIGDASIGSGVNIGAGTITCNYDGVNKSQTKIEDGAFIGSNTLLVAPVKVSRNANIGAGSTITKNAPEGKLTLSRSRQMTIDNWTRPTKK